MSACHICKHETGVEAGDRLVYCSVHRWRENPFLCIPDRDTPCIVCGQWTHALTPGGQGKVFCCRHRGATMWEPAANLPAYYKRL